ncbi:MAG: ANTAR domain-containing protein [Microbacterium sp.]
MTRTPAEAGLATALSALVAENHDVTDILATLMADCATASGAAAVALLARDSTGPLTLLAATSHRAAELEMLQAQDEHGPCVDALEVGGVIEASGADELVRRWPVVGEAMLNAGLVAVRAYPMQWRGHTLGGLNMFFSEIPTASSWGLGQAYADMATLVIAESVPISTTEFMHRLHTALTDRDYVELAKGVLAQTEQVDMERSYELILERARGSASGLSHVVRAIIEGRGRPSDG